jgi:hypothetical protein
MRVIRWVDRRRGKAVVVAAAGAFVASGLPGMASATPVPPLPRCPEAFPVSDLQAGTVATGLTVETGTQPEPFTATVLGVIDDGIAPDVDMIVARTDSPAVQRAGGVWQGMSGSPVYAPDGRLIGAVSYTLGVPSPVAGITPAADMQALLDRPWSAPLAAGAAGAAGADAEDDVELPASLEERVVATGAATRAEAAAGLRQLPLPLGVSGINPTRLDEVADRLEQQVPGSLVHAAGAAPVDTPGSPTAIAPGSNFATAISYGDVTVSGVGTTTVVCPGATGDVALAFGHPLGQLGVTALSVHPASAVHVQTDAVLGPFKVANAGGAAGTLDQDRLAGVRGLLGPVPAAIPVESTLVSSDDGTSRTGTTRVNMQQFLPVVAPDHMLANLDRVFDRIGGGTSEVRWVVTGERASGEPFTLDVGNRYADPADITSVSSTELAEQLALVDANQFEKVSITGVEVTGSISSTYMQHSLDGVLVRQPDGTYGPAPIAAPLQVVAGEPLELRLVLTPYQGGGEVRNVDLSLEVPADAEGALGELLVTGGRGASLPQVPASFDDLLAQLEGQAPNNAVTATLNAAAGPMPPTSAASARELVDQVVLGERLIPVEVVAP